MAQQGAVILASIYTLCRNVPQLDISLPVDQQSNTGGDVSASPLTLGDDKDVADVEEPLHILGCCWKGP